MRLCTSDLVLHPKTVLIECQNMETDEKAAALGAALDQLSELQVRVYTHRHTRIHTQTHTQTERRTRTSI